MTEFGSPDIPAYYSYVLVLFVGILVAVYNVNRRLAAQPGRWGFARTWMLFGAYSFLPIILFWFLDYTGALRDSSMFAALVVAAGYRQISAGNVQGITMPGQTSRLWKPFETWVNQVAESIADRQKRSTDRFDEKVRGYLARAPERLQGLRALAFERSPNPAQLTAALNGVVAQPPSVPDAVYAEMYNRMSVRILLRDLRESEPEDYGYLLRRRKLVPGWMYWLWQKQGVSKSIVWGVRVLLVVGLIWLGVWFSREPQQIRYHQWRFTKPTASELDHFRAREYLGQQLRTKASDRDDRIKIEAVVVPLLQALRFKETLPQSADHVLRLVVDFHAPAVNAVVIPQLIDALRTENAQVRLSLQRTLVALRNADYPRSALNKTLAEWVPAKDESADEIDGHVRAWQAWCVVALKKASCFP